ncbi:MAG: hypothetical protein ACK2T4_02200 [Candidatus Promineifilaceae bacterium]
MPHPQLFCGGIVGGWGGRIGPLAWTALKTRMSTRDANIIAYRTRDDFIVWTIRLSDLEFMSSS